SISVNISLISGSSCAPGTQRGRPRRRQRRAIRGRAQKPRDIGLLSMETSARLGYSFQYFAPVVAARRRLISGVCLLRKPQERALTRSPTEQRRFGAPWCFGACSVAASRGVSLLRGGGQRPDSSRVGRVRKTAPAAPEVVGEAGRAGGLQQPQREPLHSLPVHFGVGQVQTGQALDD